MSHAYYNEIDPHAAQWLRELIRQGHIADGEVDERSIVDVVPSDLRAFTQCHFFAGIGVWSHALRQGGWPDDRPVWTGSCPCQPFSTAGKGAGFADERHLWPSFLWLIEQCRPHVVFGEQVAAKAGEAWLDLVSTDLEMENYAVGAAATAACGFGAPHIRKRCYWVADRSGELRSREVQEQGGQPDACGQGGTPGGRGDVGRVADNQWKRVSFAADCTGETDDPEELGYYCGICGEEYSECPCPGPTEDGVEYEWRDGVLYGCRLGDTGDEGPQGHDWGGDGGGQPGRQQEKPSRSVGQAGGVDVERPGPTNGLWGDVDWLGCRDGKWRPVEPGTCPLAHGAPARVGRLRGYGNAIVGPQAQAFIEAYLEVTR